jgi:probable selenate reductase FAD-binding subunit
MGAIMRPETVAQAAALGSRPGFAFLGGGTRLRGIHRSSELTPVSLEKLGLSSIEKGPAGLVLGSTAVFQSLLDYPDMPKAIRRAASCVSSRTLRGMMTIGGELALRSPCSAMLAALMCLGVEVRLARKRKTTGIEEYIGGKAADLILAALVPAEELARAADAAVLRRTSHAPPSMAAAASAFNLDPIRGLRIVIGDSAGGMRRLGGAEKALEGRALPEKGAIEEAVRREFAPAPDIHASAEYKLYMAGVMIADILHGLRAEGVGR